MSENLVDYFVPLLGEAGGWKGSEVKGWEFPGSLFQHASHCHCWYVSKVDWLASSIEKY